MREPDGPLAFELDREDERSLAEQLQQRLRAAIEAGQLQSGARLRRGVTSPLSSASPAAPCARRTSGSSTSA